MALSPTTERGLHQAFTLGILLKGIFAFIETVSGVALLFITPKSIESVIIFFSQGELSENANDPFVQHLLHMAQHVSIGGTTFAALYLLSHGIVKLILVVLLFRRKLWAYPASMVVLWLFILYQAYQYTLNHSIWLIVLTIIDLVVIWLINHEYAAVKRKIAEPISILKQS